MISDLDFLLILVKKVHQAHLEEGAKKIAIDLNGGDRRDKGAASKNVWNYADKRVRNNTNKSDVLITV
jgi:uncharacterized protein YqgV (UPF0045/DUF77 family)